jgi:3-hydroxyisobutyrate dehydrogenase-like beta-hydroxyacid dehydrogenase
VSTKTERGNTGLNVGFVGMGSMGTPMVERLVAAGHTVRVHSRREETAATALALGAIPVASVAEAARAADVMTVCVYTADQLRDVCLGPDGVIAAMKPGSALLVHTTCSPGTMTEIAATAETRGVSAVDAPLDGRPGAVAAGTVRVLMGGDAKGRSLVDPVLETYTGAIIHVGEVGAGQRTKVLHVLLTAAQTAVIADAARLAGQLGLDAAAALHAIEQTNATSNHLQAALTFSDDPTQHAALVRPFVVKDIRNYGDLFDDLDLGVLGVVIRAVTAKDDAVEAQSASSST